MAKVYIAFWSGTGNTGIMAEAIAEGVTAAGGTPEFVDVESVSADTLKDAKAFALGCPSMGAEQLEESAMEPFVEEVEAFASGKQIALFGSYGWGDGEWMRDWTDRMKSAGASVVDGEGLLAIEGKITPVKRGDTVCILQDMRHGLKAINDLTLIETQTGSDLLEDDVELFDWNWQK